MENNNIKCTFCTKTFTQKKSLYAHCRKFHDTDIIIVKPFSCRNCDIKFMTEKTLSAHNKNFHKNIVKTKNQTRIICPLENCEKKFLFTFKKLREHINYDHNIEIEYEERYFCDISEFEKWKLETEQQTSSMYTLNRAASKLRDGSLRNLYYCHRSYHYRKQGNDTRSIGSNKIGRACPAMLRVTVSNSDKTVYTQFWKTHCGHVEEIVRTRLDNETRTLIAGFPKMNDSFDRSSRKRKKSPSINSTKQKRVKSNNASSVKSLPKQKPIKLDDASSILSLTPSMAYGVTEEYNSDDDLMSIAENEGSDNFIKLDMSQLTRDNGVLFSEDLTEDYEVWTMQCPTDVNIMDLHKKSLNFNDVSTLEIKNSMSGKVDLIPYKSQKDTNITIVIPSEKTKNLSLNVIPLAGTIIMSNRVKREKLDKNNQKIIPVDTIEDAARRRSQLMSKITQRLSNKYNIDTTDKTNIKIENISPKKVKKNKKLIN